MQIIKIRNEHGGITNDFTEIKRIKGDIGNNCMPTN